MLNWVCSDKLSATSPYVKGIEAKLNSFVDQTVLNVPAQQFEHHSNPLFSTNVAHALAYLKKLKNKPSFIFWDVRYTSTDPPFPISFGRNDLPVSTAVGLYISSNLSTLLSSEASIFLVLLVDAVDLRRYMGNFEVLRHHGVEHSFIPASWVAGGKKPTVERHYYFVLWHQGNGYAGDLQKASNDVLQYGKFRSAKDGLRKVLFPCSMLDVLFSHFKVYLPELAGFATLELYTVAPYYNMVWQHHPYACIVVVQTIKVEGSYKEDFKAVMSSKAAANHVSIESIFEPPPEAFEKASLKKLASKWPIVKESSVLHDTMSYIMKQNAELKKAANNINASITQQQRKDYMAKFTANAKLYLEYSKAAQKLMAKELQEPIMSASLFQIAGPFSAVDWENAINAPLTKLPAPAEFHEPLFENKEMEDHFTKALDEADLERALAAQKKDVFKVIRKTAQKRGVTMDHLPKSLMPEDAPEPQVPSEDVAKEAAKQVTKIGYSY